MSWEFYALLIMGFIICCNPFLGAIIITIFCGIRFLSK